MPKIQSFEDVNRTLFSIAKNESVIAEKEAKMNAKIQKIRDLYDAEVEEQVKENKLFIQDIESYCLLNKKEFVTKKFKTLLFGQVGFRVTTPKVHQLNRKYNAKTSLELLKKLFASKYVRVKEEMNKEAILSAHASEELDDSKLAAVGLKIDQADKFDYKINWENLNPDK